MSEKSADKLAALSPRELQIAVLIGAGKAQKTVSNELGIAISTVANHCVRIYRKLAIARKEQLIALVRSTQRAVPVALLADWQKHMEPGGKIHSEMDTFIKATA